MFSSRGPAHRDPNAHSRAVATARASGRQLLDLTRSNPTTCGLHYDSEALEGALRDPILHRYAPDPRGLLGAREAVAGLWAARGVKTSSDRVQLTASTSEAYALLFKLLCDPGDEVLAPQPSYPLFELLAGYEAVHLRPYPLQYDGAWHVDLDAVRSAVTPRTRALLIVSPNNPTGSYLTRDELAGLVELGLPLICDEVFADYPLRSDPGRARSVLEARDGLVFALDGLSKLAAMPQLKLAWITAGGSPGLVTEALERLEVMADCYLSVATPVQLAAGRLLALRGPIQARIQQRLRSNLATLRAACAASPATLLDLQGGWYAVLRLPSVLGEQQWVERLLEDGVSVQPGWFFDFPGEPFVVLSLLTPEDDFAGGVDKITTRVSRECG